MNKNKFIYCTSYNLYFLSIILDTQVTMFSIYIVVICRFSKLKYFNIYFTVLHFDYQSSNCLNGNSKLYFNEKSNKKNNLLFIKFAICLFCNIFCRMNIFLLDHTCIYILYK